MAFTMGATRKLSEQGDARCIVRWIAPAYQGRGFWPSLMTLKSNALFYELSDNQRSSPEYLSSPAIAMLHVFNPSLDPRL